MTKDELEKHPSGIKNEGELAYASAEFWATNNYPEMLPRNITSTPAHPIWRELLAFQKGWKACKDFYEVPND